MVRACRCRRSDNGQASVELIAVVPLIALVVALLTQAIFIGHTLIAMNQAAGVAARDHATAIARGEAADPRARRSARTAMPARLRAGVAVSVRDGRVTVARRIPMLPIFQPLAGKLPQLISSARYIQ